MTAECHNPNREAYVAHGKGSKGSKGSKGTQRGSSSSAKGRGSPGKGKGRGGNLPRQPCRHCKTVHAFGSCPVLDAVKGRSAGLVQRTKATPKFQSKLRQHFTTPGTRKVVARIQQYYDVPNVCQRCLYPPCEGYDCHIDDEELDDVEETKQILAANPDIAYAMRGMSNEDYHDPNRSEMAPMNAESFYTHLYQGQEDDYEDDGTSIFENEDHQYLNEEGDDQLDPDDLFGKEEHSQEERDQDDQKDLDSQDDPEDQKDPNNPNDHNDQGDIPSEESDEFNS